MSSNDELMWLIAEEGDPSAMDAFCKRHPELAREMQRRFSMVRDLKGHRPASKPAVPQFQVREVVEPAPPMPRWVWVTGAAAALFAIGYASFLGVSKSLTPAPTKPTPVAQQPIANPPEPEKRILTGNDFPQNIVPPAPKPEPDDLWRKPVTLNVDQTSLIAIFNEITAQTALNIELGPNLADTPVSYRAQAKPALEVLKELGKMVGFTVFEQGKNSVLIIPAVDPNTLPPEEETPLEESTEGPTEPPVKDPSETANGMNGVPIPGE